MKGLGLLIALALAVTSCQPPDLPSALAAERNGPPQIELSAPERYVGYGQRVELEARVTDPEGDPITLEWRQIAGRPLELDGTTTPRLALRTHAFDELSPPRDGPIQVLPLPPEKAGHYGLKLTASDGRSSTEAVVTLRAGPTTPGWPRAVESLPTALDPGVDQERYDWAVTFSPPRTDPRLIGADQRRPRVILSKPGRYVVTERISGRELALHAGPWMGTEQCGRLECHPLETKGWSSTKMASVARRGLDGQLRSDYSPECLQCHTVGFDPTVENEGFDDVAAETQWSFPRRLQPGNYAALPAKLADRANVGCEACHGPGRFYTSYSTEVCAGCHESPPDYVNPREWRRAPMSSIREGTDERPECRRCHTAQGLLDEFYGHQPVEQTARVDDAQFTLEPITCPVCHDSHRGENERLIRYGGPLWGQDPDVDWGTGMICLACHHGGTQWAHVRGALMRPFVPRFLGPATGTHDLWNRRLAPHAPQAEMLRGRGGYALPGPGPLEAGPPHLTVPGGCVGCHIRTRPPEDDPRRGLVGGHTFAMFSGEGPERVENTDPCQTCHGELDSLSRQARHDYDGNGQREGIYEEIAGLLARTKTSVDTAVRQAEITDGARQAASVDIFDGRIIVVDDQGHPLGDPERPMLIPESEERLYRAVYNYYFVLKDRSNGVHNPVWSVRLLQRTVLRLTPREVPRWFWR